MMDDALRETYLTGKEVFHGKLINVEHWMVSLPNGKEALREVVKHNGAVAVVPVDEAGNVTLVRQHRVVAGRFTWEIPAGKLDTPDEDHFSAAQRELEEETGLRAESWHKLTQIDTTPGFCTERIALYLARDLFQHECHPDADEFLHLTKLPLSQAVALVMQGEIRDAKTIVGLLMASQYLVAQDAPQPFHAASIQRDMAQPSSLARE